MKSGENIPFIPSGGVRNSSITGDAVDTEVRDVGRSISAFGGRSSLGLVGNSARELPVGKARWDWDFLGVEPVPEGSSSSCDKAFLNPELRG